MRIIAGALGGRTFNSPHGNRTHPMSDKMRGALFNVLGDISSLSILDGFAGSGALGFEALSRGAKKVLAVEQDKAAYPVIVSNAKQLGLGNSYKAIQANISSWSDHNFESRFDVVMLDPPYDKIPDALLSKLSSRHLVEGGILVLSYPGNEREPEFEGLITVSVKDYGDGQLIFYKKA